MSWGPDLDHLSELAGEAKKRPEWAGYAEFADCRSRGLRADALQLLEAFLKTAIAWSFNERFLFSRWLLECTLNPHNRALAMPQPLRVRLVVPTVKEWSSHSPENAEAHLWLGLLGCDNPAEHLAQALELDPSCYRARWTLVRWLISDVEYNQHHLPAFYIHDPRADLQALDRADELIEGGGAAHDDPARLHHQVSQLRRQAREWLAAHPRDGDFASY